MPAATAVCAVAVLPGADACAVEPAATETLPTAPGVPWVRADEAEVAVVAVLPGVSRAIERARVMAWPTRTPPGAPAVFDMTCAWLIESAMCGVEIERVIERVLVVAPIGEVALPLTEADVAAAVMVALAARAEGMEVELSSSAAQSPRQPLKANEETPIAVLMTTSLPMTITYRYQIVPSYEDALADITGEQRFGFDSCRRHCLPALGVPPRHRNVGANRDTNVVMARRCRGRSALSRRDKKVTETSRLGRPRHTACRRRGAEDRALWRTPRHKARRIRRTVVRKGVPEARRSESV
ncbi:MAG: hypothetical protein KGK10_00385 [Rhodospirillales bacterium]|nr:hypothetical protein [Rhodospirillales bacterium]